MAVVGRNALFLACVIVACLHPGEGFGLRGATKTEALRAHIPVGNGWMGEDLPEAGDQDNLLAEEPAEEEAAPVSSLSGESMRKRAVDTVGDGLVGEVKEHADVQVLQKVGRKIDSNNDGKLSHDELLGFADALRNKQWLHDATILFEAVDADKDGRVTEEELLKSKVLRNDDPSHQAKRFAAADGNDDKFLDVNELKNLMHVQTGGKVLEAELDYQTAHWDKDRDGHISLEEFLNMAESQPDFHEEDATEDFKVHDLDHNHSLDKDEFRRLIQGVDLLTDSLKKAIDLADSDGDGHIHLDSEVPHRVEDFLSSEFVEDYFFHPFAHKHTEL